MREKRVNIRIFLDHLVRRFAAAVAGPGFDPDQMRCISRIQRL